MRSPARRSPPALLLCLLALGCAPDRPSPPQGDRGRLELVPSARVEVPATRLAARLVVPRELRPWRAEGADASVTELQVPGETGAPDTRRAVRLERGGPRGLGVPGPLGGGTFSALRLAVHAPMGLTAEAQLLRAGEVVLAAGPRTLPASREVQFLEFDLPRALLAAEPFSGLRIVLGAGEACLLGPIDLVQRPLADRLPVAGVDPPHVALGDESRPALGLWSARPLRARFVAPRGARLLLFAAHLPELGPPGQRPRLELEARDANGRSTRAELPLGGAPQGWRALEVDLAGHAGQRVELDLRLLAGGAAEAFALLSPPLLEAPAVAAPRVVLVTSDAHRHDALGAMPTGLGVATPNLDRLAATGARFEYALGSGDDAASGYRALFSGRLPPPDADRAGAGVGAASLAERFRARGWRTAAVLSLRELARPEAGLLAGFERASLPRGPRRGDEDTLERALEALEQAEGRPLFLWVHLAGARTPYQPSTERMRELWPRERGHPFDPRRPAPEVSAALIPAWLRGLRDLEYPAALYRGAIEEFDARLAPLLDAPRLAGAWIAFTAPHGVALGEHGLYWDHVGLEPEIVRVPLILAGPDVPRGARPGGPAAQLDLGRTLLDLAGLTGAPFPGRSLLARGSEERAAEPLFALGAEGRVVGVVQFPWFYVRHLRRLDAPALLAPRRAGDARLHDLRAPAGSPPRVDPQRADELGRTLDAWQAAER